MLTLFFIALTSLSTARAERPQPPLPESFKVGTDISYFNSTANYVSGGNSQGLPAGGSFNVITGNLSGSYDWSSQLRAWAEMSFARAQSTSDVFGPRSASGLNEISVGSQAWFPVRLFSLVPELTISYPLWHIDENSERPLIGEGAARAQAGGWIISRTKPFQSFAFAGYGYRDSGRSGLLIYSVGAHFQHKLFYVEGSWHGMTSVTDDADASGTMSRTTREIFLRQVDGGSFYNYAINPNLGAVKVEAGTHYGPWGFWGNVDITTNGDNAADGWTVRGGLTFSSDSGLTTQPSTNTNSQFEMQNDKYDESLFQEQQTEKPNKKIRRKVRKKVSIEKLLHQTEKELQQDDDQ